MFWLAYLTTGNMVQQYEVLCETYGMKEHLNFKELCIMKHKFEEVVKVYNKWVKFK